MIAASRRFDMTRSTVLIVTPERTQSLEIDSRWLRWLRPALLTLTVATVTLAAALAAIATRYLSERQSSARELSQLRASSTRELGQLRQEVTDLRNFTSAEIEAKLAALRKSEQMLKDVTEYLKSRGVDVQPASAEPGKGQPNPAAGGVPPRRAGQPVPYTGSFARDTENLLQALQNTPLGVPHGGPLSSRFGVRANPFSGHGSELHAGLDFKGDTGAAVRATASGVVIAAKRESGYGNLVEVAHEHGYVTVYAHLSRIDVAPGQWVRAGDALGALGSTGRSTGPHLHYEVQLGGKRLNPETFLSLSPPSPATH
jgi:murein DD-endopeptidase MepM/ murein hydrolase activator NlpD